jgi:hypothetical protein
MFYPVKWRVWLGAGGVWGRVGWGQGRRYVGWRAGALVDGVGVVAAGAGIQRERHSALIRSYFEPGWDS